MSRLCLMISNGGCLDYRQPFFFYFPIRFSARARESRIDRQSAGDHRRGRVHPCLDIIIKIIVFFILTFPRPNSVEVWVNNICRCGIFEPTDRDSK